MSKKYEITGVTHYANPNLRRIRALRDIPGAGVKAGDLGGWVWREHNLSHEGDSWVGDDAKVLGNAAVRDDAQVLAGATVEDYARVDNSAVVRGHAWVSGYAHVSGRAELSGGASVYGSARVRNSARVYGAARVCGQAQIGGNSQVYGEARVAGEAIILGTARAHGGAFLDGNMFLGDDADVSDTREVLYATVVGSTVHNATLHRTNRGHKLYVGCWEGTVPEFRAIVESDEWVLATPEQIERHRPEMLAFASMCEARIASWE